MCQSPHDRPRNQRKPTPLLRGKSRRSTALAASPATPAAALSHTRAPHPQARSHIQRGLVIKVNRIVKHPRATIVHVQLIDGGIIVEIGRGGGREALAVGTDSCMDDGVIRGVRPRGHVFGWLTPRSNFQTDQADLRFPSCFQSTKDSTPSLALRKPVAAGKHPRKKEEAHSA